MMLQFQKQFISAATNFCMAQKLSSTATRAMSQRLAGKVAVVTASTEGIGYAIAERLAKEGAKVVISSRKQQNVEKALKQLKSSNANGSVVGIKCHVGNAEDRKALFEEAVKQFGGIDILVSNAAANPEMGSTLMCSEQAWDKIFEINVKCSFLLAKEILPYLKNRGGGNIVFVSSIAGYQPMALLGAYSISKTALFGLTKAVASELALENIRVNCLAPGIVKTKFSDPLTSTDTAKEIALMNVAMKRVAVPEEMAGVVAFLVSDDASYITGEVICAAGGMLSRL